MLTIEITSSNHSEIVTPQINPKHSEYSDYISLLIINIIAFFLLSYYLFNIVRNFNIKINQETNESSPIEISKNEIFKNLSLFCFIRAATLLFTLISGNRYDDSLVAYCNYICHIFPCLFFMSIVLYYVKFLVEKYYQIKSKKNDIFLTPSLEMFNIIVYITFACFSVGCLIKKKYRLYMYLCEGMCALISGVISGVYFFYGIGLANVYSAKKNVPEHKERLFIYNKILLVSLVVGFSFLFKAVVCFLVSIDFFNATYPAILNNNIWDFSQLFLFEILSVIVISRTKQQGKFPLPEKNEEYNEFQKELNMTYLENELDRPFLNKQIV